MTKTAPKGTLYGLGIGPGDPDLLTLKAYAILTRVPVLAYPATLEGESMARKIVAPHLDGAPNPDRIEIAIAIPMVEERDPGREAYDAAALEIAAHLNSGRDVAILCLGDPFLYGSFMYLFSRLADTAQIEIVPGVSSLTAAAAAARLPLAGRNDSLAVIPAPLDDAEIMARINAHDSVAIIKLGRHLPRIRKLIESLGLEAQARYIERATMEGERAIALNAVGDDTASYFSMILLHRRGEATP